MVLFILGRGGYTVKVGHKSENMAQKLFKKNGVGVLNNIDENYSLKYTFSLTISPNRCKRWVINTRREDLMKKDEKYLSKNCKLCADHFEESMFRSNAKNRLKEDAIPTIFAIPNPPKSVGTKRRLLFRDTDNQGNVCHSSL